jgi:hypothetical protein
VEETGQSQQLENTKHENIILTQEEVARLCLIVDLPGTQEFMYRPTRLSEIDDFIECLLTIKKEVIERHENTID